MKADPALRALIAAIRRFNGSPSDDPQHNLLRERVRLQLHKYKPPRAALDTAAAIAELDDWGTTDNPKHISPELRVALRLLLENKITRKRGARARPLATFAEFAAIDIRFEHEQTGIPIAKLIDRTVATSKIPVTKAEINAHLYPRRRKRKS